MLARLVLNSWPHDLPSSAPPKCWDYRHEPLRWPYLFIFETGSHSVTQVEGGVLEAMSKSCNLISDDLDSSLPLCLFFFCHSEISGKVLFECSKVLSAGPQGSNGRVFVQCQVQVSRANSIPLMLSGWQQRKILSLIHLINSLGINT